MQKLINFALIGVLCGCAKNPSLINQKSIEAHSLNVLELAIIYPTQQTAEVTSVISVLQPCEETGWHKHMVPLHAYLMAGTSTIDFEVGGGIVFQQEKRGSVLLMYGTMLLTKLTSRLSFL